MVLYPVMDIATPILTIPTGGREPTSPGSKARLRGGSIIARPSSADSGLSQTLEEGVGGAYVPVHRGLRFSAKARGPSMTSSDDRILSCSL